MATGFRPKGDLIYFAVADEESGSAHGARWMADHHPDVIRADHVLTESGGLHGGDPESPTVSVTVAEKGVAWRRLRISGTPGHGSRPYRGDNALIKAAMVIQRIGDYSPPARFHELWRQQVDSFGLDDETSALLLDENKLDDLLRTFPDADSASFLHACTHTTFSANAIDGGPEMKTNTIPDSITLDVDVRTLPGETAAEVEAHLANALGDLAGKVQVEALMNDPASISRTDTALWNSLQTAVGHHFPAARLSPSLSVGFTDSRVFRDLGSIAYGAALLSPDLGPGEFSSRFHGNNERIDIESLRLTTLLWRDVVRDLLG